MNTMKPSGIMKQTRKKAMNKKTEQPNNYSLTISSDGKKTTYAVLRKNNVVISSAMSRCHPEDTFNFYTGASIAFGRVFQIQMNNLK